MKLGIVGLPDVDRSTLLSAITNTGAESANYPFCIIDPSVGIVTVPNRQLDTLTEMYHPRKTTPAVVKFVNIAGLVKGASKGQGLGNKLLANIRECDAIVHVVRCFDDENIMHVVADTSANVPMDPAKDIDVIGIELIIADAKMVEHRIDKAQKAAKGDKGYLHGVEMFSALEDWLNDGNSAHLFNRDKDDAIITAAAELFSLKPIIYAANLDEEGFADCRANVYYKMVGELAVKEGAQVVPVCVKLEAGTAELDGEEKKMSLDGLGIAESGLGRLVRTSCALLGLISFLTSDEDECCAWTIRWGTKAPQAADKIRTNFERGFTRAEVVNFDDLVACGSMSAAREKDLVRSEGKEYIIKDGNIVLFWFNV